MTRLIPAMGPWAEMRAAFTWNIPPRANIAAVCCDDWADRDPARVAVIDRSVGRRVWTYGALRDLSARLAGGLAAAGVGRGDRVAILLPQRAETLVAHLAALRLGAVSLPLFGLFGPEALTYRLRDSGAVAVIGDAEGLAKLEGLDLPDLRCLVDADDLSPWLGDAMPCMATGADDPAMMIYTSGTTGAPKGVLHAHRFLWGHLPCVETALDGFPRDGDVGWTPADWAWIGGLMDLALPCLFYGVPLVARRFSKFDAAEAWRLMVEEGVTCAFLPPTALRMMRRAPVPEGLALRAVLSGGEALGADMTEWGRTALGAAINEIYGQTECNLVMAACAGQGAPAGTLGRAVPGVEVSVRDAAGAPVAEGGIGEICVRGSPAAFLRYWNKPEATAAKWRDGWLRTGDLGEALPDGVIRYHARDDDVINSAGYRIGPTEIETCLTAHPCILLAAVVGLPDAERGMVVTAFLVPDDAGDAAGSGRDDGLAEEAVEWVKARLSPHMAPRDVRIVAELPMTATGKVRRAALREAASSRQRDDGEADDDKGDHRPGQQR